MEKNVAKFTVSLILAAIIGVVIINSSLSTRKQEKQEELVAQKILQDQLAEKKTEEDAEEKVYLLGKFDPSQRSDFSPVPDEYDIGGYKMYLRKETLDAFLQMATAAKTEGVNLKIVSATRNFDYQKNIWNTKWDNFSKTISDGKNIFAKILEYSAVPGTSRHHWGTEIDINGVTPAYFDNTEEGREEYEWLVKNASLFGFCQTYNQKGSERLTGYNEEKWHWSYLPLSKKFTQDYKNLITADDINGFDGDEYVKSFDLINNYVLAINLKCL